MGALARAGLVAGMVGVALAWVAVAGGTMRSFPTGAGWANPAGSAQFEDHGFGSCTSAYAQRFGDRAHLGADSQGTGAGHPVVAMAAGTVVQHHTNGWGAGQAIGIGHTTGSGEGLLAVYAHINPSVRRGDRVARGQQIGTVSNWGANSHLHLGVRPLGEGESADSVPMLGYSECDRGTAPTHGYVDPLPWLSSHTLVNHDPRGELERVGSPETGRVQVSGWAYDPNSPKTRLRIHVYVGGRAGQPGTEGHDAGAADQPRFDVAMEHGMDGRQGFDATIATGQRGSRPVCVYALNVGRGRDRALGCETVTTGPGESPAPAAPSTPAETPSGGGSPAARPRSTTTCAAARRSRTLAARRYRVAKRKLRRARRGPARRYARKLTSRRRTSLLRAGRRVRLRCR